MPLLYINSIFGIHVALCDFISILFSNAIDSLPSHMKKKKKNQLQLPTSSFQLVLFPPG